MEKGLSVIICCYNSAKTIGKTLQHLAHQQVHTLPAWEVVLVDNNCTDDTVNIAKHQWQQDGNPVPLRIVKEPEAGLMYARKHGVNTAQYDLMIFCDDDNFLAPNYLQLSYEVMTSNEKIGALGGCSEGYYDGEPPAWFSTYIKDGYAIGKQFIHTGDITWERGYIWGAGMVSRTALLRDILNAPFTTTDRKGASLASGGDTEICYKLIEKGYLLYYDDRLFYQHYITDRRLTWDYVVKLSKGITQTIYLLLPLKRRIFLKLPPEKKLAKYIDLIYLFWYNFKFKYLFQLGKIKNLHKHEGDMKLWEAYFNLYHIYSFYRIRILNRT